MAAKPPATESPLAKPGALVDLGLPWAWRAGLGGRGRGTGTGVAPRGRPIEV